MISRTNSASTTDSALIFWPLFSTFACDFSMLSLRRSSSSAHLAKFFWHCFFYPYLVCNPTLLSLRLPSLSSRAPTDRRKFRRNCSGETHNTGPHKKDRRNLDLNTTHSKTKGSKWFQPKWLEPPKYVEGRDIQFLHSCRPQGFVRLTHPKSQCAHRVSLRRDQSSDSVDSLNLFHLIPLTIMFEK